jgi:hypothetical protein
LNFNARFDQKKHFLLIQTPHHPVVLVSIQNMMHYDCSLNLHLRLLSTYFFPIFDGSMEIRLFNLHILVSSFWQTSPFLLVKSIFSRVKHQFLANSQQKLGEIKFL